MNNNTTELLNKIIHPPPKTKYEWIGHVYEAIHFLYEFLLASNILFCEDIENLIILLNITFLNILGIFFFKRCPLEVIVKTYCDDCISDRMREIVMEVDKTYSCHHVYENHMQLLGTAYAYLSLKIMLLIIYKTWMSKIYTNN